MPIHLVSPSQTVLPHRADSAAAMRGFSSCRANPQREEIFSAVTVSHQPRASRPAPPTAHRRSQSPLSYHRAARGLEEAARRANALVPDPNAANKIRFRPFPDTTARDATQPEPDNTTNKTITR